MPGEREPTPQNKGHKPLPNEGISPVKQEGNIVDRSLKKALAAITNRLQQPSIFRQELATGQLGVSAVSAPPRPAESPTRETERKRQVPPTPSKPKKHLSIKAKVASTVGALLALGSIGLGIKHHVEYDVPDTAAGIVEDITTLPQEWELSIRQGVDAISNIGRKEMPVSPTFDNKADKQSIQTGINAFPVSQEELQALIKDTIKPLEKDKFPDVAILLPIKLKDNQRVDMSTNWVNQAWNHISQKPDRLAYGKKIIVAQKGTEIIVPVENAQLSISETTVRGREGKYVDSFVIIFNGPDGTRYNLVFASPQDIRQLQPTETIRNVLANGINNLPLPIGAPIAITDSNNVEMQVSLFAYPTGYPENKLGIPSNYSFIEKEQNGKLFVVFKP